MIHHLSSRQFVDAYMKENPNVEIKVIDTSADEYNNSFRNQLVCSTA